MNGLLQIAFDPVTTFSIRVAYPNDVHYSTQRGLATSIHPSIDLVSFRVETVMSQYPPSFYSTINMKVKCVRRLMGREDSSDKNCFWGSASWYLLPLGVEIFITFTVPFLTDRISEAFLLLVVDWILLLFTSMLVRWLILWKLFPQFIVFLRLYINLRSFFVNAFGWGWKRLVWFYCIVSMFERMLMNQCTYLFWIKIPVVIQLLKLLDTRIHSKIASLSSQHLSIPFLQLLHFQ